MAIESSAWVTGGAETVYTLAPHLVVISINLLVRENALFSVMMLVMVKHLVGQVLKLQIV